MKKILVIIDMQNDFIFSDFALGNKHTEAAYANLMKWLGDKQPGAYDHVVLTRDTHQTDYLTTAEGVKLPISHCIEGTEGWEIPRRLYVLSEQVMSHNPYLPTLVDKKTFGSVNLPDVLENIMDNDDEWSVEFCGLCTDICVVSNVLMTKAFFPELPISVHEKFCAGVTPESHAAAITTMKSCQIDII